MLTAPPRAIGTDFKRPWMSRYLQEQLLVDLS